MLLSFKMEEKEKTTLSGRVAAVCPNCHFAGGFKKVPHLPISDLDIYMHREQEKQKQKERVFQVIKSQRKEILILHNANPTELNNDTVIKELNKYNPKCISCRGIIRRVKNLLEEIRTIRKSDTHAVCDHCKFTAGAECKRCNYVVSKFKSDRMELLENQRQQFKAWLAKVKELLQNLISGGQICRYGLYQEKADIAEFENLLRELYPVKSQRQPEIGAFPSIKSSEDLAEGQGLVRAVIRQLKLEGGRRYSSVDSLYVSPSRDEGTCVCKVFQDRAFAKTSRELLTHQTILDEAMEKRKSEELFSSQPSTITSKTRPVAKPGKENRLKKEKTLTESLGVTAEKIGAKKATKSLRKSSPKRRITSLVTVHHRQKLFGDDVTSNEDILICDDLRITRKPPKEMIRGLEIVPFDKNYLAKRGDEKILEALFFNENFVFKTEKSPFVSPPVKSQASVRSVNSSRSKKIADDGKEEEKSGVIMYRLSDRKFIDNGWTQLPSTKIMRRMNIYKMLPASPLDWFSQNKDPIYYESGEKLSEVDDDSGRGFWFYKNGLVALEYCDTPDSITKKRFTILSHEVDYSKKSKSQNVLACFDYCGNGIVYDTRGNERLKYNQSEGYVIDDKIGAPGRWKWHSMNDPPILEQIFVDTHPKNPSPELEELMKQDRQPTCAHNDSSDAMLDIELKNFAKEKSEKLMRNFKPFEIRMKAVKVNDHFALKVIDQSNIYLSYRDGGSQLKLNLGMMLQSDEIVATELQEAGVVETPYDRRPTRNRYMKSKISIA